MKTLIITIANLIADYIKQLVAEYRLKRLNKKIKEQEVKTNEAVKNAEEATNNFLSGYDTYISFNPIIDSVPSTVVPMPRHSASTKDRNRKSTKARKGK
jgi:hypothetical protein